MKIVSNLKYTLLILATVFTLSSATAQETETANTGFIVDEIVSKVDNYIVLKSELERAYQDYLTNGGTASQQVRCQYLALLIRNKLMMAKAEIDSVVVADDEVDQYTQRKMDMIIAQAGVSPDELEERYGKTLEQIRLEIRDQEREQLVVRKMQEEITKGVVVTPAEVKRFFNRMPKDSLPYFSASVEVAQIVKVAKVSEAQKNITRTDLASIRNRILAGEDFTTLAKKYSDDPSVTSNGGDMGWSGRGRMVPEYEAMAFKLKPNEISMPFESPFGFHIMQLLERRGNEYHSRHILISPKPSPQDIQQARHYLDSVRRLIVADSLKFTKAAKEVSDDTQTKGNGGFFSDGEGGTKLLVDELDPVVFFKIDSMNVGDVSHPITYRTDEGKDAVRILLYKSRYPPHQASLNEDWSRIQAATLNEKKDRILQKWFNKARKDVFISIDPTYDYCGILDE
ncbi:MAG TPA: peptidylprolyl isomerase [Ohtaekwangia sp.]|uniref:peptidylprolyl isomerase n=1 Tax=Ohtaekwangia sp. TaxID=2066019 RepID=UPI002F9429C7